MTIDSNNQQEKQTIHQPISTTQLFATMQWFFSHVFPLWIPWHVEIGQGPWYQLNQCRSQDGGQAGIFSPHFSADRVRMDGLSQIEAEPAAERMGFFVGQKTSFLERWNLKTLGVDSWRKGTYKSSSILERNMIWTKPPGNYRPAVNLQRCFFGGFELSDFFSTSIFQCNVSRFLQLVKCWR